MPHECVRVGYGPAPIEVEGRGRMADEEREALTPADAWRAFVAGLGEAGEKLARRTEQLSRDEQADGFRALLRALRTQLGRFEVDRERPELVPFNGWRQKFFMDNPDFLYWVADIRPDRRYRVYGARGDAAFVSITAYRRRASSTPAAARLDADSLTFDADGRFSVTLSAERPASGDWLPLPEGVNALWVRHFHEDVQHDALGACAIEPLDAAAAAVHRPGALRAPSRATRLGDGSVAGAFGASRSGAAARQPGPPLERR